MLSIFQSLNRNGTSHNITLNGTIIYVTHQNKQEGFLKTENRLAGTQCVYHHLFHNHANRNKYISVDILVKCQVFSLCLYHLQVVDT